MSAKVCEYCRQDCSNKPRVKDPSGRYFCKECYPAAQAAANTASGGSDQGPIVKSVFDEPIIPTAEMIPPKEDPKSSAAQKAQAQAELPPKNCPSCGVLMPATGVVCTNCGLNITSGKAVKTKIEKAKAAPKAAGSSSSYSGEYAGVWPRFVAALVDGFIAAVVALAVGAVCGATFADPAGWKPEAIESGEIPGDLWATYGAIAASVWLYFSLMESSANQATIGRRLMGISLSTVDGGSVSFLRSSGRYWLKTILYSLPLINFAMILVNVLMVAMTPRKQTPYDLATGVVICR